jgi:hypothetical protein
MNDEIDRLRQQVQELAGRVIADAALLRQTVLDHGTIQLRDTQALVERLGDDPGVKNQLRGCTPATLKAFEEQRKAWSALLAQEMESRNAASPQP